MRGEEFRAFAAREVREILQNPPDWKLPIPCPREKAILVGAVYEITLTCARGHATCFEKTTFMDEPINPTF